VLELTPYYLIFVLGDGVSEKFSVHSFYEWLSFGGVISDEYAIIWKSNLPFKIKFFMWLVRKRKY
jgi:zinc-binding in reverse transcriptase